MWPACPGRISTDNASPHRHDGVHRALAEPIRARAARDRGSSLNGPSPGARGSSGSRRDRAAWRSLAPLVGKSPRRAASSRAVSKRPRRSGAPYKREIDAPAELSLTGECSYLPLPRALVRLHTADVQPHEGRRREVPPSAYPAQGGREASHTVPPSRRALALTGQSCPPAAPRKSWRRAASSDRTPTAGPAVSRP
jgi:hypothetical protein